MTTRRQTLGLLAAGGAAVLARPGLAAAPFATVGNPGYYRFRLGSHEITALSDGTIPLPMTEIYQNAPEPELERRLHENFLGPDPHVSINAYLINTGRG